MIILSAFFALSRGDRGRDFCHIAVAAKRYLTLPKGNIAAVAFIQLPQLCAIRKCDSNAQSFAGHASNGLLRRLGG